MVPCCDYVSEQDFEPNCAFGGFLLPSTSVWESSTPLDVTASLRKIIVSLPGTYQVILLFKTLPTYRFERVFPRLFVGIPFLPTLSQSEGTMIAALLSIIFDGLFWIVTSLNSISHLFQWVHLVHLHWRSVDHQEAPHCGANFCDSIALFAILINHPWMFVDP
jgi:hypothetical protein